ncbi:Uncharacterized protein Adt_01073 [Abeliophyllum distichum]|uniref:DUF4283 domain-containing protein n=1 Tax=Abeliophyllum distichum TaxID=126358 RepID=A0ABD1VUY2_9LAMI
MGKKSKGNAVAKKAPSVAQKAVHSQPVVAESSAGRDTPSLKEFWDGLCNDSPVRSPNNQVNQLDDCSLFPALPCKSAPKAGTENQPLKSPSISVTLGEFDTESDGFSEKNYPDKGVKKIVDNVPSPKETKAPWVSLFKDNRRPDESLTLQVFDKVPGRVDLEVNDADDLEMIWGYSLIGYFAGRFPGKKALLNLCGSWNVDYEYYTHSSGWLVFKFLDNASREKVLKGGPYFVFGRPLLLKIMPEYFQFDDDEISLMPVWVVLPELPLAFWNPKALGKVVSQVGKPISMDNLTSTRGRLSYARVLVEVDASKELIKSVQVGLLNGKVYDQRVVFEHEPKFCTICHTFGHSRTNCAIYDKTLEEEYHKTVQSEKSNVVPTDEPKSGTEQHTQAEIGTADPKSGKEQPPQAEIDLQGQTEGKDDGDDAFVLVDRKKKSTAFQKTKQQPRGKQPQTVSKEHSSRKGNELLSASTSKSRHLQQDDYSNKGKSDKRRGNALLASS